MSLIDYKTRLPNQFEDAENLRAVIDVVSDKLDEGNDVLDYLLNDTTLDDAEGVWLDEIGDIVGAPRGGTQVSDALIFTYKDVSAVDDPTQCFGNATTSPPGGGYYAGVDGLPDGALFGDTDYRALIRAKIASTYSGDSIGEIWTWINTVFGIDAYVYTAGPASIGIDLPEYMTHTNRRLLETYAPRGAGIWLSVVSWPSGSVPGDTLEDDMSYRFIETSNGGVTTIDDSETAVHLIFYGSGIGHAVEFADATTFTTQRLYRITNQSGSAIAVSNSGGTKTDSLLIGNVMQCTLSDITTDAAGDWIFLQHLTGAATGD